MMDYTKAEMLQYLKEKIDTINILPIELVDSNEFFDDRAAVIKRIIEFSQGNDLIIRSSSTLEDTSEFSNAGQFMSVMDVKPNAEEISRAISEVYESYNTVIKQQILVQPMLEDIKKSGVVFTADMETLSDYYIVNYHEGKDTAAVTGGYSNDLKTFVHYKKSNIEPEDKEIKVLLQNCEEIENELGNNALDIEFATTQSGQVFILQVRPIAHGNKVEYRKLDLREPLNRIYKKVLKLSKRHPFLLGHTTCFGVMPDWNPAEILGVRPKKLAISLYKELITDNIWAHQRADYGYRDLTMHPLMISFGGIPYIDTRITFNSFVPQKLNDKIAEKLVDYYLNKLSEYPKYHDKIEFEIVYSCYYLGIHEDLKDLRQFGFNENEITRIEFSLLELTNDIIDPKKGLFRKDISKIHQLEKNYEVIMESEISLVDKIYWLIEECKTNGTLPFAGVARAAFIAVQFLKSFVKIGIITEKDYNRYMESLETVNKRMNRDLARFHRGDISQEEFLNQYGHIRPGTYDILSKRYDEAFEEYFSEQEYSEYVSKDNSFCFTQNQIERIQTELDQNGLLITAQELLDFIKESIEGREYLKFGFTKLVSEILRLIGKLGERVSSCVEEMAVLDVSIIKQLYVDLYTGDIYSLFETNINQNKEQYQNAIRIKMPSIIVKPEDVYTF